jgi:hypothetical protein
MQAGQIKAVGPVIPCQQLPSRRHRGGVGRPLGAVLGVVGARQEVRDLAVVLIAQHRAGGVHQPAAGAQKRP